MKYKIAHVGAFDFENFGDLLFTDVLEKQLRTRIDVEKIIYFAPKKCKMPNKKENVNTVVDLEKIHKNINFDAIIVGGGDLIHLQKIITYMPHVSDEWVTYETLYMWVIPCIIAWKYNIPLIWNAPGVPLEFMDMDKRIVKQLCECVDYISVRDEEAKRVLSAAVNPEDIKVVPDTVLSIANIIKKETLDLLFTDLKLDIEKKKYVFFQCNVALNREELKICGQTLLKIKEDTGYEILLQPIGYALGDEPVLREMKELYPNEFLISQEHLSQYQILALIANAALYIGTSLHGAITATSYNTNNIVYNINHYNKTDGFVKMVGKEDTRVYKAKDIWNAYLNVKSVNLDLVNDKIEEHFDKIANMITTKICKKNVNLSMEIAEHIYIVDEEIRKMTVKMQNQRKEYLEIKKKYNYELDEKERYAKEKEEITKKLNSYRQAYEGILNSKIWKIFEPARQIKDYFKQK